MTEERILQNRPLTPSIAPGGAPTVISGVPNPQTQISKDIRNSLYGTGSLNSGSAHINSIQNNINRALSVSAVFSNKPATTALQAAQASLKAAASAKDAATRNAALAAAKQSLITANNAMSSLGYGKAIGSIAAKPNTPKYL